MSTFKKGHWLISLSLLSVLTTACSGGSGGGTEKGLSSSAPPKEDLKIDTPTELVVFGNPGDPEEVFNARIGDAVRKKFPNYTIKYLQHDKNTDMDKLIASSSQVDLIYDSVGGAGASVLKTGSQFDISELVKKHQVDLSRFDASTLEAVKQFGGLYGLPIHSGGLVLYYNKDIFDKFGVGYPKNGMTWDEAIALGNKLTRTENGTQYIGLGLEIGHAILMNSLSLPYVDKNTNKAAFNTDDFKKLFDTLVVRPAQAPGYRDYLAQIKRTFNSNDFMKTRNLAMYVMNYGLQDQKEFSEFNWDMAPLPVFKDKPGVGSQPYPAILFVTNASKNKDQAVEVLKYLTSDEYQMDLSQRGFIPVLKNDAIRKAFAQKQSYKDKNVSNAIFYNKIAPPPSKTDYDGMALSALGGQFMNLITGATDLNTAFRDAEDAANKKIAEAMAAKK